MRMETFDVDIDTAASRKNGAGEDRAASGRQSTKSAAAARNRASLRFK